MKTLLAPIILLFIFWLQSCATVSELSDSSDRALGYTKNKTADGKTIYKRKRVKDLVRDSGSSTVWLASNQATILNDEIKSDFNNSKLEKSLDHKKSDYQNIFYTEAAFQDEFTHLGLGLGLKNRKNPFEFKLGLSIFGTPENTYAGFDIALRWYTNLYRDIQPFVGGGLYLGDNKTCQESFENDSYGNTYLVEECSKTYLSANYVELGVRYKDFSLFAREYGITDAGIIIPARRFIGIGYSF